MFPNARLQLTRWLCAVAGLLLAACQAAPTVTTVAAPTAAPTSQASAAAPATVTSLPKTATPLPSATLAPSSSPSTAPTVAPTATRVPLTITPLGPPETVPSATVTPTATATTRRTPLATRVPQTITPLGPPETAPLLSTTGGPAGYAGTLQCQRAGAGCAPVMPAGDVNFHLTLAGDSSAPWTHFVYLGLSVERDGANVADAFMFAGEGWLQPATVVGYDVGRGFSQPGIYVIRVSGCLTTDLKSNACVWNTIAGDVVTFRIQ